MTSWRSPPSLLHRKQIRTQHLGGLGSGLTGSLSSEDTSLRGLLRLDKSLNTSAIWLGLKMGPRRALFERQLLLVYSPRLYMVQKHALGPPSIRRMVLPLK